MNGSSLLGIFLEAQGAYTYDHTLGVYIENAVIGKGIQIGGNEFRIHTAQCVFMLLVGKNHKYVHVLILSLSQS